MKNACLAVGDRRFYFSPDEMERVMDAAANARNEGEWLQFQSTGGRLVRLLIPADALLEVLEYETDDDPGGLDPNDWASFDYDLQ